VYKRNRFQERFLRDIPSNSPRREESESVFWSKLFRTIICSVVLYQIFVSIVISGPKNPVFPVSCNFTICSPLLTVHKSHKGIVVVIGYCSGMIQLKLIKYFSKCSIDSTTTYTPFCSFVIEIKIGSTLEIIFIEHFTCFWIHPTQL